MSTFKGKITSFHWCFQCSLVSRKTSLKTFFCNSICFIINHDFYVITLWMHDALFSIIFRRNKVNWYWLLSLPFFRFFKIIYNVFQKWFNFIKIFFDSWNFFFINIVFIFGIIIAWKIIYSYWFAIIFLRANNFSNSVYFGFGQSNYFVFYLISRFISICFFAIIFVCFKKTDQIIFNNIYSFFYWLIKIVN